MGKFQLLPVSVKYKMGSMTYNYDQIFHTESKMEMIVLYVHDQNYLWYIINFFTQQACQ